MTTTTHIPSLDHSVDSTNVWLADLAAALGTDDRHESYRVLRAFLHTLREGLTVGESADLAAQLPVVIRGMYFQDWRPHRGIRRFGDRSEFLRRFAREAQIESEADVEYAASAALATLRRHVSPGEVGGILHELPPDVRELLDGLIVHASS